MILQHANERRRFLKFALVGSLGAAVDFSVFNLLTWLTPLSALPASMLSFLTAVTHNFLWHRFWTFSESRTKAMGKQWVQFALVSLIGLSLRTPLFALLEKPLRLLFARLALPVPFSPSFLGHNLALAIVILVVMVWNFIANRLWTFNDVALGT